MTSSLKGSFDEIISLTASYLGDPSIQKMTVDVSETLSDVFQMGGKVLICGNGGSACDAMHFAEEFTGRFRGDRKALPVISLTDASHLTCVANDYGFEHVFSRGVEAFGTSNDVFIGLSTSGNSQNVINAHNKALEIGLKTILFLGKDGGVLKGKTENTFIVPANTSDRIQEIHMSLLHLIIEGVERRLFPENY